MQVSVQEVPGGWQVIWWEYRKGLGNERRVEYCTSWETVEEWLRFAFNRKPVSHRDIAKA